MMTRTYGAGELSCISHMAEDGKLRTRTTGIVVSIAVVMSIILGAAVIPHEASAALHTQVVNGNQCVPVGSYSYDSRYPNGIVLSPEFYEVGGGGATCTFTGIGNTRFSVLVLHYETGWGIHDLSIFVLDYDQLDFILLEETQVDGEEEWNGEVIGSQYVGLGGEVEIGLGADAWDNSDVAFVKIIWDDGTSTTPYISSVTTDKASPLMGEQYTLRVTVTNPTTSPQNLRIFVYEDGTLGPEFEDTDEDRFMPILMPALRTETYEFHIEHDWKWTRNVDLLIGPEFLTFSISQDIAEAAANKLGLKMDPGLGWFLTLKGTADFVQEEIAQQRQVKRQVAYTYRVELEKSGSVISQYPQFSVFVEVPFWKWFAFNYYLAGNVVGFPTTSIGMKIALSGPLTKASLAYIMEPVLIVEGVSLGTGHLAYLLSRDPDPNYTIIEIPDYLSVPELDNVTPSVAKAYAQVSIQLQGDFVVMFKSFERYMGALEADDDLWASLQLSQALKFADRIANELNLMCELGDATVQLVRAEWARLTGTPFRITMNDVERIRDHVRVEGFDSLEVDVLQDMGLTGDQIQDAEETYVEMADKISINYDFHMQQYRYLLTILQKGLDNLYREGVDEDLQIGAIADAGHDIVADEGDTVILDGANTRAFGGTILSYEWLFDGFTFSGDTLSFVWYDNCVVEVTLRVQVEFYTSHTNKQGKTVRVRQVLTFEDTIVVHIINVDPSATIDAAYMLVDFTLRGAGEKWHNVLWDLYETDWPVDGGEWQKPGDLIAHLEIERFPGDPDKQSDTVGVYIDMEKIYYFITTYNPYEDDNPISGQLWGANPIWIDLTFEDGSTERIHHTFNVQQSLVRDSEHWVHVEPWYVDLSPWFVGHVVTFEASTYDPGTDDVTFIWDWGDGTANESFNFTYRPDGSPDPPRSPYDRDEGSYPVEINRARFYHTYLQEDDFVVELTVVDDDDGSNDDTLEIDAIHTQHIYPTI